MAGEGRGDLPHVVRLVEVLRLARCNRNTVIRSSLYLMIGPWFQIV